MATLAGPDLPGVDPRWGAGSEVPGCGRGPDLRSGAGTFFLGAPLGRPFFFRAASECRSLAGSDRHPDLIVFWKIKELMENPLLQSVTTYSLQMYLPANERCGSWRYGTQGDQFQTLRENVIHACSQTAPRNTPIQVTTLTS